MSLKKEIRSAIAMHSMWKGRLEKCIKTGVFDTPVNVVEMENECYFGKWLYGENITPAVRSSEQYQKVKDWHAQFHRVAAQVVKLSLAGEKAQAANLMQLNGEYTRVTTELIGEMTAWANSVD